MRVEDEQKEGGSPSARIKARAREIGFSGVGIARAELLHSEAQRLLQWLDRGYHATMNWMAQGIEKRIDPSTVLADVRSVIAVALNYYTPFSHTDDPATGKVSRYAWGDDYHAVMRERIKLLWEWVRAEFPRANGLWYVDTGPVMDKVWAQRSGIGWIGKHTNVITKDQGSWVFLGEILTTLDLEPDPPAVDHCGRCTLCMDACPTDAIVEPYVVDSNRCLSYLTIEHRGEIAGEITQQFEGWIFGCDICQDVCPWNVKFARPSAEERFTPRKGNVAPILEEWCAMTEEEFRVRFRGSPIRRARFEGLMRNVSVVRSARGRERSR